jgi:hypothetical protein
MHVRDTMRAILLTLTMPLGLATSAVVEVQAYPAKSVRVINPFARPGRDSISF